MDEKKSRPNSASQVLYKWENITKEFSEAVKDVALDEIVHDKLFSLLESMSAIEMMDPKMDAGMKCNRENNKTFQEAVNAGIIKLDNLSNIEIIDIIDSTFSLLVSWLEGHSLLQTVFTNLYLHNPYSIKDEVLKTFCLAMYKLIDIITDLIYKAMVFEEEDFQPMTYNFELNPDISEESIISKLREIEENLYIKSRVKKNEKSYPPEVKELDALLSRIKFTRAFYQCLYCLLQPSKGGRSAMLSDCQRLLELCKDMLSMFHSTMNFGMQSSDTTDEKHCMGIEPLLNLRFLPPTFFQQTIIKPKAEAFSYLNKLIGRLKTVCKINNFVSFHNALEFFTEFNRNETCVLSRSILHILYINEDHEVFGSISFTDVLKDAICVFISPPSLINSSLFLKEEIKQSITNFFSLCTQPFVDYIKVFGYNKAKQQDKYVHLLQIFAKLQTEAQKTDVYLHNLSVKLKWSKPHSTHFSTWILYHILKIMVMYLLTGFELELYSSHEYYYIFWYLYEFLYGWLVSVLTKADSFILGQHILEIKSKQSNKTSAKNKNTTLYEYHQEIVYNRVLQNMCGGYYKALYGFRLDGIIKLPQLQYNSEQVRYDHRFAPFASVISPPPVSYMKFLEMTSSMHSSLEPQVDTAHLYHAGCKHFHQASCLLKTISSRDTNTNNLLKVANANFIVLKHLAKGHKKDSTVPPDFDFLFHKHLPVIKLN